jgi:hypothetical protein
VAFATPTPPDRRSFVALFSDGQDNASITSPDDLFAVAARTTTTMSLLLASPVRRAPSGLFARLAADTGGVATAVMPSDRLGDGFRRALDQFRASYVLTFVPQGVPLSGRHRLDVRVNRPGVEVRARREYIVP